MNDNDDLILLFGMPRFGAVCIEKRNCNHIVREPLIYSYSVIPAQAGIQKLIDYFKMDSGSTLRFVRNDE